MVEIERPALVDQTKARLDQIVNDYLDAKEDIVKAEKRVKQLTDEILALVPVGGRHEIAAAATGKALGVRVQPPPAVFTDELAKKVLTPEQYQCALESKATAKQASKWLPDVLVDQCRVPGTKPVVVKL